jgi:hypothetical protein
MDYYKLYNETKSQWEYVLSIAVPTVLPDNPGDTLKADSQTIEKADVLYMDGRSVDPSVSLVDYKTLRYNEIDRKTGELISLGFEYPASSGNIFSFSENAQSNLLGAYSARDLMTYPFEWSTKDDSLVYSIADATEMSNFFMTALATKKARQDSGTALKIQINSAADRSAVDAIIDNR